MFKTKRTLEKRLQQLICILDNLMHCANDGLIPTRFFFQLHKARKYAWEIQEYLRKNYFEKEGV